jgi:acetyl-CoA C-acetyltransferase
MQEVVIVGAARTPFGLYHWCLGDQRCQDWRGRIHEEAIKRSGIDSSDLDGSIFSEAMQTSLPANVGRPWMAFGRAGRESAGFTMNTLCAGALQTVVTPSTKL